MLQIITSLKKNKIVAIIRGISSAHILKTALALHEGGINCLEVTFDQLNPQGYADTLKSLNLLREHFTDKLFIGAGTVLTVKSVNEAAAAGAQYIISPNTDKAVVECSKAKGLVSIPGALTPTEIMNAHTYGADIVKLFPAGTLGLNYVKAIRVPLSHIQMMAVGGISPENIRSFLDAGLVGAGVGGKLVDINAVLSGEFEKLTQCARKYVSAIGSQAQSVT